MRTGKWRATVIALAHAFVLAFTFAITSAFTLTLVPPRVIASGGTPRGNPDPQQNQTRVIASDGTSRGNPVMRNTYPIAILRPCPSAIMRSGILSRCFFWIASSPAAHRNDAGGGIVCAQIICLTQALSTPHT